MVADVGSRLSAQNFGQLLIHELELHALVLGFLSHEVVIRREGGVVHARDGARDALARWWQCRV